MFLFLPDGEDPDSLVRAEGRDAFERRLDDAVPLSRLLFDHLAADTDPETPEGGARFVEHLRPLVARIPSGPFRRQLVMQIGELYAARVPAGAYRRRMEAWFDDLSRHESPKEIDRLASRMRAHTARLQGADTPATRAVRMLLHEPSLGAEAADAKLLHAADLADSELLAHLIEFLRDRPDLKPGALLEHYRQHAWFQRIEELAQRQPELSDPARLREEFAGCLRLVLGRAEHRRAQRRLEELTKRRLSELSIDERREFAALTARKRR